MNKIFIYIIIGFMLPLLIYADNAELIDINHADMNEIYKLPVKSEIAENIYNYIQTFGNLNSFTDLYKIPGITDIIYNEIIPMILIVPGDPIDYRSIKIDRLRDRLASEDNPGTGAIELWENLLLYPYNLNEVTIEELNNLYKVSLVDAAAVIRYRLDWEDYRYISELKKVKYLSSYGYRNIRNYVYEPDSTEIKDYFGILRVKANITQPSLNTDRGIAYYTNEMSSFAYELNDPTSSVYEDLTLAGWSEDSISSLRNDILKDINDMKLNGNNVNNQDYTFKGGYGRNFRVGMKFSTGNVSYDNFNGFLLIQNLKFIDILALGDYRLTLGEGIAMDNANPNDYRPRQSEKIRGIYGDLSVNNQYGLRGGIIQLKFFNIFYPLAFVSKRDRSAIQGNGDTVVVMFSTPWSLKSYHNTVSDITYGGGISLRLDNIPGTAFDIYGFSTNYDKYFSPDPTYLDIPNDKEQLVDGNFLYQMQGKERNILSFSGRTVVFGNLSFSGEYARQYNNNIHKNAYIISSRLQYDNLYIYALKRHYDIGYDNPYNRGFTEQQIFEDTELEKPYRLLNPIYAYLQDDPRPKAEDGIYIETRYQILRQLTITKAYLDIWENLANNMKNYRAQITVDYRIVYPLSLRIRQKWQNKNLPKPSYFSTSKTFETEINLRFFLGNGDIITTSLTKAQVQLSQRLPNTSAEIISGYYLSGRYEHEFTPGFSILGGIDGWNGEDMSQWEFEDMGLDFLYGYGVKSYIVIKERLSDELFIRLKIKHTSFYHPYYGFEEIYDNNQNQITSTGFNDINNSLFISLLIDYHF